MSVIFYSKKLPPVTARQPAQDVPHPFTQTQLERLQETPATLNRKDRVQMMDGWKKSAWCDENHPARASRANKKGGEKNKSLADRYRVNLNSGKSLVEMEFLPFHVVTLFLSCNQTH